MLQKGNEENAFVRMGLCGAEERYKKKEGTLRYQELYFFNL